MLNDMDARFPSDPIRRHSRPTPIRVASLALLAFAGCLFIPPARAPIPSILAADPEARQKTLVVMLPGMGDRAADFVEAGFVETDPHPDFDVIAVDAHFGYYTERNLVPRLHEDVIVPALARGYEKIWLLGISMGGFGSLLYASEYPNEISGVILLSPFLGSPGLIRQIEAAGGLESWNGAADGYDEHEIAIWRWLKRQLSDPASGRPVILGYGRSERMARTYGPLIEALDPSRLFRIPGRHEWTTWKPLWATISDRLPMAVGR